MSMFSMSLNNKTSSSSDQDTVDAPSDTIADAIAVESIDCVQVPHVANLHQAYTHIEQMNKHDRSVRDLQRKLSEFRMIAAFSDVAKEHSLSAPLVAAFRATPGFDAAVASFPKTELFNIVPEHKSSPRQVMGLESFEEAVGANANVIREKAAGVCKAFCEILESLNPTVDNLKKQVAAAKDSLEASDVTDEVMATLPVHTLSHEAFTHILGMLEEHLSNVESFDDGHLRADPEQIKVEIDGLTDLVGDLGRVLGIDVSEDGVVDADKDPEFEPTPGDFGEKAITKAGLVFYLDKANTILSELDGISMRKGELMGSLDAAVENMPESLDSDDVTYGCVDHVTLMSCYTKLVTKLIRESIVTVTMLLSAADSVLHIDDGLAE